MSMLLGCKNENECRFCFEFDKILCKILENEYRLKRTPGNYEIPRGLSGIPVPRNSRGKLLNTGRGNPRPRSGIPGEGFPGAQH